MDDPADRLPRRHFLGLTAALGLGGLLAACGTDDASGGGQASAPSNTGPVPDPTGAVITRWRQDPYALGSYSYLAVGAEPDDRLRLAEPIDDRLFFAGEATDPSFPATVHGALLSGRRAADEVLATDASVVAVIGAGAAGIGAAHALAAEGREVVVYEARDRIGGRVRTDRSLGVPVDLGASWIHGVTGNPLTAIADDLGIERVPTDYENLVVRDAAGTVLAVDEVPASFDEVAETELDLAADGDDLSPLAALEGEEYDGADVIFPGGYDRIFDGLAGEYEVVLSALVEAVDHAGPGVELTVGGERVTADAAVVTLPLGVLKAGVTTFDPPLPPAKAAAVDRLGMGLLDKVHLRFDEPFWDVDAHVLGRVGPERGRFAWWLNLAAHTGEPILIGFHGGSQADDLARGRDDQIVAEAMDALRGMYPAG
jgi:monoamine oxidase